MTKATDVRELRYRWKQLNVTMDMVICSGVKCAWCHKEARMLDAVAGIRTRRNVSLAGRDIWCIPCFQQLLTDDGVWEEVRPR